MKEKVQKSLDIKHSLKSTPLGVLFSIFKRIDMIYTFKSNFIKSLQDSYSIQGHTHILNNSRYYVAGLRLDNYY